MIIDENKLQRQQLGVDKVIESFSKNEGAILQWVTGMGKTFSTFLVIKRMKQKDSNRSTIIIVPTIPLKEQWEKKIKEEKLSNTIVYVINTVVLHSKEMECDLLVLDECHKYVSEEFYKIFTLISSRWLLGLSATITRPDDKHSLLLEKAKIVDTITLEEATKNGWVAPYLEYNLGIEMNEVDKQFYKKLNDEYHKRFGLFGHDFDIAMRCLNKSHAERYAYENNLDPSQVIFNAVRWNYLMQQRKKYLYKTNSKIKICKDIVNKFPLKTVIFSEATDFAEDVKTQLGDICLSYHSKLKGEIKDGKKIGPKKIKNYILERFKDNRTKIRVLSTAKALDVGFDDDTVELGILASCTTNPTQRKQRIGRVIRNYTYKSGDKKGTKKRSLIINLYIKGTQDEKWLRDSQKDPDTKKLINPSVKWINSLNEIDYDGEYVSEITTINPFIRRDGF